MKRFHHLLLAFILLLFIAGAEASSIDHALRSKDAKVQEYIDYAWEISNQNLDFVATLEAENGRRDPKRQSNVRDKNGIREDSRGFCQLNRKRHGKVVNNERFFTDWKRQMEQCYKKYKGGTKFYGYNKRNQLKKRFTIEGAVNQSLGGEVKSKYTTNCRYAGRLKKGQKIQLDRHVGGIFKSILGWLSFDKDDGEGLYFICDE